MEILPDDEKTSSAVQCACQQHNVNLKKYQYNLGIQHCKSFCLKGGRLEI